MIHFFGIITYRITVATVDIINGKLMTHNGIVCLCPSKLNLILINYVNKLIQSLYFHLFRVSG